MTRYNRELCMSEEWCVGAYRQTDPEADVCTCARARTHTHTHTHTHTQVVFFFKHLLQC